LHDRLLGFIRARVGDEAAAEDILQDAFLKIHARIGTLRDEERLESWVWQIVRHAIADHLRGQRPAAALSEELPAREETGEDDPGDAARQLVPFVRATIDGLPGPYRDALLLTEYGGLTQQELAARAGLSLSGAKSRVQRAREKVKALLLACCHFELDRRGGIIDYRSRSAGCACASCGGRGEGSCARA
jgi:RNA polymerase sigma-70 factor, ECF subfamily